MILESKMNQKRFFNAKSKTDLDAYKKFLKTNGWGSSGCPFFLVFPYMTVPHMIQDKIIHNVLGVKNDKSSY
jgi:hypothetical protein